ncbi:ribonuclease T2 family protein [Aurantimonas marianensis]|uniref:Ribonuclease T n=1 Tax=Aurantimonas marianensis TaxID=2920428 RepID=A0A9X2H3X9_9HYPH|nr:ribonuclease T [Aurantimonas marianensis]MCP3055185.1 ribonuclease T [Aurantimonas marianensis]
MKRFCLLAALLLVAPSAFAQVPMTGRFVAEARCPALQSIRKQTNPGGIATEPGVEYVLVGRNAEAATHYYVVIPDAEPPRRWVAVGCGRVEADGVSAAAGEDSTSDAASRRGAEALAKALGQGWAEGRRDDRETPPSGDQRSGSGATVLAASWHAAFCETKPRARDCRNGGEDGGFVLHGLWPQPRGNEYCGVAAEIVSADRAGDWSALPEPQLSRATRRALDAVMPGAEAILDRHQWVKHGSCYGADAEEYFADAVALIGKLNASPVRRLFVDSLGQQLDAPVIRAGFDKAFGHGAGQRVLIDCARDGGRQLIAELRINLAGTITPQTDLGDLIRAANPAGGGCRGGVVDAAGWQ